MMLYAIPEMHHPGYHALRHIASGLSVKIKRLSPENAQSPIRGIIKCHILTVVGMFV